MLEVGSGLRVGPSEEVCLSGRSTASVVYKYCLYMPLQNQLISDCRHGDSLLRV